jgi:hypothetical protein
MYGVFCRNAASFNKSIKFASKKRTATYFGRYVFVGSIILRRWYDL